MNRNKIMKLKTRIFWLKIALREIWNHGRTDYNIFSLLFSKNGGIGK